MSLIVGVTNGSTIVVGADSKVYEGDDADYRTYTDAKLRLVNQNHWVASFTGLGSVAKAVWNYLEAAEETYDPDIRVGVFQFVEKFGEMFRRYRLTGEVRVLLAGFSGNVPHMYKWSVATPDPQGGDLPPWSGIGCGVDVALHLITRCQPLANLNTQDLQALVYFSISEKAGRDPRVDKPIDICSITPAGAVVEPRESVLRFDHVGERFPGILRDSLRL